MIKPSRNFSIDFMKKINLNSKQKVHHNLILIALKPWL